MVSPYLFGAVDASDFGYNPAMSGSRIAIAAALTAILALFLVFNPGSSITTRRFPSGTRPNSEAAPSASPTTPGSKSPDDLAASSSPSVQSPPPNSSVPVPQAAPAFPNLIDNGDFESYDPQSRPRIWRLDPEALFLWDKLSRGPGDRSLFIDASRLGAEALDNMEPSSRVPERAFEAGGTADKTPPTPATIRYPLPALQPGAAYILSLWLARDNNIDGVYPTISLGGQSYRLSDFWTSGRWQRISLVIALPRMLPPDARRLELRIPPGDYRLWIDDIVLRRIDPPARILGVKNGAAGLSLSWRLPSTDRLLDIRVVISRDRYGRRDRREVRTNNVGEVRAESSQAEGSRGEMLKVIIDPLPPIQSPVDKREFDPAAAGVDELSLPLDSPGLAGRWFARVEVYQYRKLLAQSETLPFKIGKRNKGGMKDGGEEERPPRTSDNREAIPQAGLAASISAPRSARQTDTALDSFPLGIFGARPEDFAALRAAGFNAAQVGIKDAAALSRALADASRYGLSLLISPPTVSRLSPPSALRSRPSPRPSSPGSANAPVFNSPAPLAPVPVLSPSTPLFFYLADEPEGRSVSPKLLFQSRASLLGIGLPQPGAIALCRSWRAADYASTTDIFIADPYPIPFEPLSWLAESLDEIGRTVAGDPAKRVWAMIQAFSWETVSEDARKQGARPPTSEEILALTRLALLHGADGLFFYGIQGGSGRSRDEASLWQAVKDAAAEARLLKPLVDAPPLSPAPTVYCPAKDAYGLSAVHFRAVRPPAGPPLLLALNTLDRPIQAAIHLPGRPQPIPFALEPLGFDKIEVD